MTFVIRKDENWCYNCWKVKHLNEWTQQYGQTYQFNLGTEERMCCTHPLAFLSAYHLLCKFFTMEPHHVKVS